LRPARERPRYGSEHAGATPEFDATMDQTDRAKGRIRPNQQARERRHPPSELFNEVHVERRAPHLGNVPSINAVEGELRDGNRATRRRDAEE
jgi:hypothetical protein